MPQSTIFMVALATRNGAHYLSDQLHSIAEQTRRPDALVVSDDGSDDRTLDVVSAWTKTSGIETHVLPPSQQRLGPKDNFARALAHALALKADLVSLCDQDDYWRPDRLEVLGRLLSSGTKPALATSDLRVVDASRNLIFNSYWQARRFPPHRCTRLTSQMVMNGLPGCSMACNRALLELAMPIPPAALMHDWWLALLAVSAGTLHIEAAPLVDYRQHGRNAIGAQAASPWQKLRTELFVRRGQLTMVARQARAAMERVGARASPPSLALLETLASCEDRSWLGRRIRLLRAGIGKIPIDRNVWFQLTA